MKDLAYCPICSNHLNNVILSLSVEANTSFVNGGSGDDNDSDGEQAPGSEISKSLEW